jgi:hypothetical protein
MNNKTSNKRTYEIPEISIEPLYAEYLMQNFTGGDNGNGGTGVVIGGEDSGEDEPQRVVRFNTNLWED